MTSLTLSLAMLAFVVTLAAWHGHRLRNEPRDVALLAVAAALLGSGSVASAVG
ncbi:MULTISPECIES: hypothetical protein [Roseateles]|uniref:Membrane protein YadS n=1 Tax=Pelomonas aquatica TaxID=431058 RepID=A0ABU1Z4U9_9BURK|nr:MULTISPECIES: hypothetical protein [Roseateles]MDR7295644.1 putative membrane protein YadS [Pelomonas aquatica]